jgi:hypothetical protein
MKQVHRLVSAFIVIFLAGSCTDEGETYIPPRIVPGKSIDGIRIGDSREAVEAKLGRIAGFGNAEGYAGKGWYVAKYDTGVHAGLAVYFIDLAYLGQNSAPGLVDEIGMRSPYDGRTDKNVGIGSSLAEIRQLHGPPKSIWTPNQQYQEDTYCFGNMGFSFFYRDSIVNMMFMGVLYPTPIDTICP